MKWYKYKQFYAWGEDKWKFILIPDYVSLKDVGEHLDSINYLNNWSDKWRSVEWKRVYKPPRHILLSKIKECKNSIINEQEQIKEHKRLFKKLYGELSKMN